MNSPEKGSKYETQAHVQEKNFSAIYAHGLLTDQLLTSGLDQEGYSTNLPPGFINKQESEFASASHVELLPDKDKFYVIFINNDNPEYIERDVYVVDENNISVIHEVEQYDDSEIATVAEYKRAFKAWAQAIAREESHQFHYADEAARLKDDIRLYEQLRQQRDTLFDDMVRMALENDRDTSAQGGNSMNEYYQTEQRLRQVGTPIDSNLGATYEQAYQALLQASMDCLDLLDRIRADMNENMQNRMDQTGAYAGSSIGPQESSSLIRVLEKILTTRHR